MSSRLQKMGSAMASYMSIKTLTIAASLAIVAVLLLTALRYALSLVTKRLLKRPITLFPRFSMRRPLCSLWPVVGSVSRGHGGQKSQQHIREQIHRQQQLMASKNRAVPSSPLGKKAE